MAAPQPTNRKAASFARERKLEWILREKVIPNEHNPRHKRHFAKEELLPLKNSIAAHGILEPIIVQPYKDDLFLLIEGERRFRVATDLGLKEIPAIIVKKMQLDDQMIVMFNVHTQRRGWEKAEELRVIDDLLRNNGSHSDYELAQQLGISLATFRDRKRVLEMGPEVVADIARDKLDYSSALRTAQATATVVKARPELAERLGGAKGVEQKFLEKAKSRGGISQELVEGKKDLADVAVVPDTVVETYLTKPDLRFREARKASGSLEERRKVEGLSKDLRAVEREIRQFRVDLEAAPNLRHLRAALVGLIDAAQELEQKVLQALLHEDEPGR